MIRILPAISSNIFPLEKLSPMHANIRSSTTPSTIYNASILVDIAYLSSLTQLYQASESCPAFRDATLLGKVWLRQRGFSGSFNQGGFGSFEWTWFLSFLLRTGGPNDRHVLDVKFSSFQLFRGALNSLVMTDRVKEEVVECIDSQAGINVFYKMTPSSYRMVNVERLRLIVVAT
jgi:U3 small nucleolar RNA-associated protein 22